MSRIPTRLSQPGMARHSSRQVLITGASGYLGQFLIESLCKSREYVVTGTFNNHDGFFQHPFAEKMGDSGSIESARNATRRTQNRDQFRAIGMDLTNEASIQQCLRLVQPNIVVHCAAISSPASCERDAELAKEVNCPIKFMNALREYAPNACFVLLSTDHVYDGRRVLTATGYNETSPAFPLNTYGRTKLEFEQWIRAHWASHVILRSSVIYGPVVPCQKAASKKSTVLQFLTNGLRNDDRITLFGDERRSFVFVDDVVRTIKHFVDKHVLEEVEFHHVFNMGGPQCVSRVEVGEQVCEIFGLATSKIENIARGECKEEWAHVCRHPKNLPLVSSRLYREVGRDFLDLSTGLQICRRIEAEMMASPLEQQMAAFSGSPSSSEFVELDMVDID